jgi:hypothetical protein
LPCFQKEAGLFRAGNTQAGSQKSGKVCENKKAGLQKELRIERKLRRRLSIRPDPVAFNMLVK